MLPESSRRLPVANAGPGCGLRRRAAIASGLVVTAALLNACDDAGPLSSRVGGAAGAGPASAAMLGPTAGVLPPARLVRYVKLVEATEWTGKAWAAIAEFNVIDSTGANLDRKAWVVSADSADVNDPPANAIDGNPKTHWHSRWQGTAPLPPHQFIVDLGAPAKVSGFRILPRQDGTLNGSIAEFRFYVSSDGIDWGEPVTAGDFTKMGPPALEKTVVFAQQTDNHPPTVAALAAQATPMGQPTSLQVVASDADADVLSYAATGLPSGLTISRTRGTISGTPISPGSYDVTVSVGDNKGPSTDVALKWTVLPPPAVAVAEKAAPGEVRFVKLEEVSEIGGRAWASVAEFNLLDDAGKVLPRTGWTASADSADASDIPANAIDGNPATVWHSQWDGASPPPPHSLILDLKHFTRIGGFRYLPRQDRLTNGVIAKFRFYTSVDGIDWGKPVAMGDFSAMGEAAAEKTVHFK